MPQITQAFTQLCKDPLLLHQLGSTTWFHKEFGEISTKSTYNKIAVRELNNWDQENINEDRKVKASVY